MKERIQTPADKINIIIPNCLRVDIATIFLKSLSITAQRPASSIVKTKKNLKKEKPKKENI